jgi:outer membrane receptor protein involved in Fe transport
MALLSLPLVTATAGSLDEIVVTATLRDDVTVRDVPASIALLDRATVRSAAVQHFEELAALVPNLNWSGEGSRARYFQVRGTGELEQYEGAPNASVGFIIDDIDFSAIGGIATTFDTERIEVLRGPQGTRYGANALAGLIYVQSAAPPDAPEARAEAIAGSDGALGVGVVAGGPVPGLEDDLTWRVAVQQFGSDGFRNDAFLGRDDTYDRDELTARAKLRWRPAPGWQADLTALRVDLDNGYDAWAIDNGFTTQSDKPGADSQRTTAGSLRVTGELNEAVTLVSITGAADSDILFSFDGDWGNADFWAPYSYDFTERNDRERRTINQELRLVSGPAGRLFGRADWVAGAYLLDLEESNLRSVGGIYEDPADAFPPFEQDFTVASDFDATSLALFGEVSLPLDERTRLTLGLRGERRDTDYDDEREDAIIPGSLANHFSPEDDLWGGELALTRDIGTHATAWARIARGYRAGGFNPGLIVYPAATPGQQTFGDEHAWDYEIGLRLGGESRGWWADLNAFWQDRGDMQVKVPVQLVAGDPTSFVFLTENAESGRALGMEAALGWRATGTLTLTGSLGLLDTDVRRFSAEPGFEDRPFPHAPAWSAAAGVLWQPGAGWFARLDVTGRDSFWFDYDLSSGGDRKSHAAKLVNLRAGRDWGRWRAEAWLRNALDEEYAVRGFWFGNEPPAFAPTRYIRLGDPRQAGVTLAWRL